MSLRFVKDEVVSGRGMVTASTPEAAAELGLPAETVKAMRLSLHHLKHPGYAEAHRLGLEKAARRKEKLRQQASEIWSGRYDALEHRVLEATGLDLEDYNAFNMVNFFKEEVVEMLAYPGRMVQEYGLDKKDVIALRRNELIREIRIRSPYYNVTLKGMGCLFMMGISHPSPARVDRSTLFDDAEPVHHDEQIRVPCSARVL